MFLQSETSFGLNLLNQLHSNESLVFSPLSIALALSLVQIGAKGKTKEEIEDVLLKGANDDQFLSHFQFISESLKASTNGVKTNVANRVFVKKSLTINPTYLSIIQNNYNSTSHSLDFTAPEAVKSINNYVRAQTNGKIDNLVDQNSIKDAVALLINAIYFKGDWMEEFDGSSTVDRDFTKVSGELKKIPFMSDPETDRVYAEDDIFQVGILDYKDLKYRFAIFLPKIKNSLGDSLKKLDAVRFQKLLSSAKGTYMTTIIPKFTIERELKLKESLEKLGIKEMFSDSADLSGIAENVKISDGLHKAIIEINEEGTEAAAATSAKAVNYMLREVEPLHFQADHPFLFALVHENHPLFLGVFHG